MSDYNKRLVIQPPKRGGSRLALGTYGTGAAQIPAAANAPIPASIVSAGPNITSASLGTPVATGTATVHQPYTITIGDFIASKNPPWFQGIKVYKRAHADTHVVPIGKLDPQASSVTWSNAVDLGSGSTTWDIGFSYAGTGMSESAIVWPSALANIDPGKLLQIANNAVGWANLVGDSSGDTTTPIADTSNKRLLHAGMSTGVQGAIDSSSNFLNLEFPSAKLQPNGSVTNVDGVASVQVIQTPSGSITVLKADITGTATGAAIRGFDIGGNLATNFYRVIWDNVSLRIIATKAGITSTLATAGSSPAADTNTHSIEVAIIWNYTPGANYIEATVDGIYTVAVTDGTSPLGPTSVNYKVYTGGSAGTLAHLQVKGSGTTYGNTPGSYQGNFDSSGTVKKSTMFVPTTPNTISYVTDATIEFSWTGTGPYSVNIWFDNGTAATDASVVYPDGSPTVNLGHTTSGAPSYSEAGVAGGTKYYAVLSRAANGTVSMTVQKTPFTIAAFAAYFADGGIVPACAQGATPLFTASGTGGSGSRTGGGGGRALN